MAKKYKVKWFWRCGATSNHSCWSDTEVCDMPRRKVGHDSKAKALEVAKKHACTCRYSGRDYHGKKFDHTCVWSERVYKKQ